MFIGKMKNFIIVPACTDLNRGDQVLVWEAVNLIKDAYPNSNSFIVDYGISDNDREQQSHQTRMFGFNVISNIVEHPKRVLKNTVNNEVHNSTKSLFFAGGTAIFDFCKLFFLLLIPTKSIFSFLFKKQSFRDSFVFFMKSDCIVVKGGGFIHTYGKVEDLYYLWFNLYYVILAKRTGKKVIILPNSYGPIKGYFNRAFVKFIFNKADLIYSREKISTELVKEIGCKKVKDAFDLGYYIKESESFDSKEKENIFNGIKKSNKKKVAITVRPYRFPKSDNPDYQYLNYINTIVKFCCQLSDKYDFYFIVQVDGPSAHEKDRIAIDDITAKLPTDVTYRIVDNDFNCLELTKLYSLFDFIVGTRFHSIIFSHVVKVPGLAIAYGGNKTRGIMKEIGLEDYVIDIEDIDSKELLNKFFALELNKTSYIEKLKVLEINVAKDRISIIKKMKELAND
ncbi:polysaccharide pyruvyl transferase family protein [Photobacterium damselae]|uniref:polysaccharide pyruvyl transferase family protein n=1 Tax=Photobacterium damselae TaxID=38293 RepID=UPI001EFCCCBF|nr:polysaccharide pyruvyl transferase family protein [Photobacterium damselae]MCG9707176.1 polysaccharide pyruvyl transferase family protein [Photobacterium damselae]